MDNLFPNLKSIENLIEDEEGNIPGEITSLRYNDYNPRKFDVG